MISENKRNLTEKEEYYKLITDEKSNHIGTSANGAGSQCVRRKNTGSLSFRERYLSLRKEIEFLRNEVNPESILSNFRGSLHKAGLLFLSASVITSKSGIAKNDTLLCPFQGIFCFFIEYAAEGISVVTYGKRIAIIIVDNNHLITLHLILRFLRLRH